MAAGVNAQEAPRGGGCLGRGSESPSVDLMKDFPFSRMGSTTPGQWPATEKITMGHLFQTRGCMALNQHVCAHSTMRGQRHVCLLWHTLYPRARPGHLAISTFPPLLLFCPVMCLFLPSLAHYNQQFFLVFIGK